MRTYVIISSWQSVTAHEFDILKSQGVEQTSMDTARKSKDSTQAILKWSGDRPAGIATMTVAFEGSHAQLLEYLEQNKSDWGDPEN